MGTHILYILYSLSLYRKIHTNDIIVIISHDCSWIKFFKQHQPGTNMKIAIFFFDSKITMHSNVQ